MASIERALNRIGAALGLNTAQSRPVVSLAQRVSALQDAIDQQSAAIAELRARLGSEGEDAQALLAELRAAQGETGAAMGEMRTRFARDGEDLQAMVAELRAAQSDVGAMVAELRAQSSEAARPATGPGEPIHLVRIAETAERALTTLALAAGRRTPDRS